MLCVVDAGALLIRCKTFLCFCPFSYIKASHIRIVRSSSSTSFLLSTLYYLYCNTCITRIMLSTSNPRPTGFPMAESNPPMADKPKKKKPIRQAVGVVVGDPATGRILMLTSRKRQGALVLPRGERAEGEEAEAAALRILQEEGSMQATGLLNRLGTYIEANKRGKTIAHHWMYEIPYTRTTIITKRPPLPSSSSSSQEEEINERTRVWVTFEQALEATMDRPMSRLALTNSSFAKRRQ